MKFIQLRILLSENKDLHKVIALNTLNEGFILGIMG